VAIIGKAVVISVESSHKKRKINQYGILNGFTVVSVPLLVRPVLPQQYIEYVFCYDCLSKGCAFSCKSSGTISTAPYESKTE
jgi:hypothetical protein